MNKFAIAILPAILLPVIFSHSMGDTRGDHSFAPAGQAGFARSTERMADPGTPSFPTPVSFSDGPYISYGAGSKLYVRYIYDSSGQKAAMVDSGAVSALAVEGFKVNTDQPGKTFTVKLKGEIQPEKADYPKPARLLMLSDFEGNFAGFRKLLQAAKVIDNNLEWTFGDGHVAFCGDFVDRGEQVTEVLWFIYALEEKAKKAGGMVHYILGNHEIMNLSGDLRYLNPKYAESARLINKPFTSLYGADSELGRWMRSKNVMERIGDIVLCHAGISAAVNRMDINVKQLNAMVRPFYDDSLYVYSDPRVDTLYGDLGPFWYRGYYAKVTNPLSIDSTINESLAKFKVNHVVTGHTIVADTVSMWYDGKVFDLDTHHAKGHSEALLLENKAYYRINAEGEKKFLKKD